MRTRAIIVVCLLTAAFLVVSFFYTKASTSMIVFDYPQTTKHGWPLWWVTETRYTDPLHYMNPPTYHINWMWLSIDLALYLVISALVFASINSTYPFLRRIHPFARRCYD